MKKIYLLLIVVMLISLALTGCKAEEPGHEHNYDHSIVFTDPTDTEMGYSTHACECGESYTSIGEKATEGITYSLNDDNTYTVTGAFNASSNHIIIPSHYKGLPVVAIADGAFKDTGIVKVVIPATITKIGHLALCASLNFEDVEVNPSNPAFTSIDGVLYSKDTKTIVQYPIGRDGDSFEIPSHVKAIGNGAFTNATSLTSVSIPDGVTDIGIDAFNGCIKITELKLPESLTSIGDTAFASCHMLKTINVPNSVATIGEGAFYHCESITAINIPNGVTSIKVNTFSHCYKLLSVVIPDTVISIGESAFDYCDGLVTVHMSASVQTIGDYAFSNCKKLSSITLPGTLNYVGMWAFSWCESLKSVSIPASIGVINDNTFYMCKSLETIDISEGITRIGDMAFYECVKLESLFIPESVALIGDRAFARCLALKTIRVAVTNKHYQSGYNNDALYTSDGHTLIQYAVGRDDKTFSIYASVEKILVCAFSGAENLGEIYFASASGWMASNRDLDPEELAKPDKAAYYLTEGYDYAEWIKG